eukprot:1228875-Amphidinium_carterae.1
MAGGRERCKNKDAVADVLQRYVTHPRFIDYPTDTKKGKVMKTEIKKNKGFIIQLYNASCPQPLVFKR